MWANLLDALLVIMVMLRAVLVGAISGYMSRAVQAIVNIMLVPFLLSDTQLGLAGFGTLSSLLVSGAFLAVILDGWRLSVGRNIGLTSTLGEVGDASVIRTGVVSIGLCTVVGVSAWNLRGYLVHSAGVSTDPAAEVYVALLIAQFMVDQVFYPWEMRLHACGLTWRVNWAVATESVVRGVLVAVTFLSVHAGIEHYLAIFVLTAVIRQLFVMYHAVQTLSLGRSMALRSGWQREFRMLWESPALALQGVSAYTAFRLPVLLVNGLVGPEGAGVLSVLLMTVRTYLQQFLVSILHPMMVPLAARFRSLTDSQNARLLMFAHSYEFIVCAFSFVLALLSPIWLSLWLGEEFSSYRFEALIGVVAFGLEIASIYCAQILVGQGHGRSVGFLNLLVAASVMTVLWLTITAESAVLEATAAVTLYIVIWNGLLLRGLYGRLTARGMAAVRDGVVLVLGGVISIVLGCGVLYMFPSIPSLPIIAAAVLAPSLFAVLFHYQVRKLSVLGEIAGVIRTVMSR